MLDKARPWMIFLLCLLMASLVFEDKPIALILIASAGITALTEMFFRNR